MHRRVHPSPTEKSDNVRMQSPQYHLQRRVRVFQFIPLEPAARRLGDSRKKKRWVGSGSCMEMGPGWAACDVFGGGRRAWECVNTARDLESCGGFMFRPLTSHSPVGTD
ncbi:hypothetical protein BC827DRAFT_250164 [Russula dissimulans]|nr:hypothetical protein BC827DRAFT_250164 [Russula dissimulans]